MSEFQELVDLFFREEDRIIRTLVDHAKGTGYTRYTSTLEEARRASIRGLNRTFQESVANIEGIPEHHPDKDYTNDPVAAFGVLEARLHRSRGITLPMFLGLMKYYRQAYIDCVRSEFSGEKGERFRTYVDRVFEHIEIGFVSEWITSGEPKLISELQGRNRAMTNEKNLYLTIFESMPEPVAILDEHGGIITVNHPYSKVFLGGKVPGERYYGEPATVYLPMQVAERIKEMMPLPDKHGQFQTELESANGRRSYLVQTTKMLDISEKYQGMIVIFNEVTERERMMHELVLANEKIRLLGEMTRHDVLNLLTIINGNLQLLEMKAGDASLAKHVRTSIEASKDIQRLLEASRDYQRLGSQKATWMNLANTVRSGLSSTGISDDMVNMEIGEAGEGVADPLLERVVTNLAFNTLKHAPTATKISIWSENNAAGGITIWFEDDGPGIPFESKATLFEEKLGRRTGHGLHFVRRLLEITGMSIREVGEPGKGVRFAIDVAASGHRLATLE